MTLDEAIKHAEEVAEENQSIVDSCDYYGENMIKCEKCAEEHRQLAEWLKDYKVKEEINQSLLYENERLIKSVQEIKAEIENMTEYPIFVDSDRGYIEKYDVLKIIDKYMSWEGEE